MRRWSPIILGLLLLAALLAATAHFAEAREFLQLARRLAPWWLAAAVALQLATYTAQGASWRLVARTAGAPIRRSTGWALSLAKLFVDQSVPTAGVSGTLLAARALERDGVPRPAVLASITLGTASTQAAFVLCLGIGLGIATGRGEMPTALIPATLLALLVGIALAAFAIRRSGRPHGAVGRTLARLRPLRPVLDALAGADPKIARRPRLLLHTTAWQAVIILLDAATLWALLQALGAPAHPADVFAAFVIASVFRTFAILSGGLGTFDGAAVLLLRLAGVGLPAALSATLLFRGLSFWLPMLPGWWLARGLLRSGADGGPAAGPPGYWHLPVDEVTRLVGSAATGLGSAAAEERLRIHGPNSIRAQAPLTRAGVLWNQLRSPLLLLLLVAAGAALLTGEWIDAVIVLVIVTATVLLGYSREYRAQAAAAALQARLKARVTALRDGTPVTLPLTGVVPGDVVLLAAGSLVPGDAVVLEATDFFVSEAVLTGESFPVEKRPGAVGPDAVLAERTNCVFLGTNVRSGTARCLVVATGAGTEFGRIAHRLAVRRPETEFDRGTRRFGYLLTIAMLVLILVVFTVHVLNHRPPVETLLFALALAVGLSPELLPAILSVNLARGAQTMAAGGVLVRRLNAIENLGSMDILCTDKTGTLTEGTVVLEGSYDPGGAPSARPLDLGVINAALETGIATPLDDAILAGRTPDLAAIRRLAEIPFDFVRKRVSVVVEDPAGARLVTKGAAGPLLDGCVATAAGTPLTDALVGNIRRRIDAWSDQGIRVLAVATRTLERRDAYGHDDERDLDLVGFLTFFDRPKAGAAAAVQALGSLGVGIKLITGDNRRVAQQVAALVGLRADRVVTGGELTRLNDEALWHLAEETDLFAEVDPNQKERIIRALKATGHVVGFLGDGVNDAPAMHAADTSLSVDQAADVAREAADFVLLQPDLDVIRRGITEGRQTFANTLKYVQTTTSANLGNMLSMAAASLLLPFLPLLPGQILLNNFLSDIPAIGIADDSVDPELVSRPERWNIRFIGRFMVVFGLLSSAFDFLTFGILLRGFHTPPALFRTGWFVESLLTELVIALVVRTRRPCIRSRPGRVLLGTTLLLIPVAFLIPALPHADLIGLVPLPAAVALVLTGVTLLYVLAAELAKFRFYRRDPRGA